MTRRLVRFGDIGDEPFEIEFEPIEEPGIPEPIRTPVIEPVREPVPA